MNRAQLDELLLQALETGVAGNACTKRPDGDPRCGSNRGSAVESRRHQTAIEWRGRRSRGHDGMNQQSGVPSDNTTLTAVLGEYEAAGYTGQFEVISDAAIACVTCGEESDPRRVRAGRVAPPRRGIRS